MLPNFFVIGAMKSGTSSLHEYLGAHPQIFACKPKELHYFVEELNWKRGRLWYEDHFESAGSETAIGESSPTYSMYPRYRGVPARMFALTPEARLIYVMRHPIERIQSHYFHRLANGTENRAITEALTEDPTYIIPSRYGMQLEQYLQHFDPSQVLVVTAEQLRGERAYTLRRIFEFLAVDPSWRSESLSKEFHRTGTKRAPRNSLSRRIRRLPGYAKTASLFPTGVKELYRRSATQTIDDSMGILSPQLREYLEAELRPEVHRLRRFFKEDFDGWGMA